MEQLSKYDPFTIDEIEFYMQKKSKFTTCKSIIVSLTIVFLSVLLSYGALKNIWMPRSELVIETTQLKTTNTSLTQNLLCVISPSLGTVVPESSLINYNKNLNKNLTHFQKSKQFSLSAKFISLINGRDYTCYNMQGALLNADIYVQLTLQGPAHVLFKTWTLNEIIGEEQPNYVYFQQSFQFRKQHQFYFEKFSSILYDQLLVDYQPEFTLGLSNNYQLKFIVMDQQIIKLNFYSEISYIDQLTQQVTVSRQNIGQILGSFFSWFSILILIFTTFIAPIVQQTFQISLAQSIYKNQKLDSIQNQFFTFIKFMLSRVIKGVFKEQILHHTFYRLQQDLNIVNLIRKQTMMKKLIAQTQYIQRVKQSCQQEVQNTTISPQQIQILSCVSSQTLKPSNQQQEQSIQTSIDKQANQQNVLVGLIKLFDVGETSINLITNKGDGYSSQWNTLLTIGLLALMASFLVFAGFFVISSTTSQMTVLQGYNILDSVTIQPEQIIFQLKQDPWDELALSVNLINANNQFLRQFQLLNGQICDKYALGLNQSANGQWYCLAQPIILKNDGKNSLISLNIKLVLLNGFGMLSGMMLVYSQTNYLNGNLQKNIVSKSYPYDSNFLYFHTIQIINEITDTENNVYWTSYMPKTINGFGVSGVTFQLQSEVQQIQTSSDTIWDVINNVWGVFILCFSVFLSRIAGFINIKKRQTITSETQNMRRNDITKIVKTQYKLGLLTFRHELNSVKYFYKQNSRDFQKQKK